MKIYTFTCISFWNNPEIHWAQDTKDRNKREKQKRETKDRNKREKQKKSKTDATKTFSNVDLFLVLIMIMYLNTIIIIIVQNWHKNYKLVFVWEIGLSCFIVTFNYFSAISWRSVLLLEETGVHWENPPSCRKSLTKFIT